MERFEFHPAPPEDAADKRLNKQFLAKEKLNKADAEAESEVDLTDELNSADEKAA